jgi:hypothetical protein
MRTWGRQKQPDGSWGPWIKITDTQAVWLATLVQTLRLTQGESPLYGGFGIPAPASVKSQIAPDAAVARTQAQYVQYFASLAISAVPDTIDPTYNVEVVLTDGTILNETVAT